MVNCFANTSDGGARRRPDVAECSAETRQQRIVARRGALEFEEQAAIARHRVALCDCQLARQTEPQLAEQKASWFSDATDVVAQIPRPLLQDERRDGQTGEREYDQR